MGAVNYQQLFKQMDLRANAQSLSASQMQKMTVKTLGSQIQEDPFAQDADAAAFARVTSRVSGINYRALLLDLFGPDALRL